VCFAGFFPVRGWVRKRSFKIDASGTHPTTTKGHWGTGDVEIRLSSLEKVGSVVELIKQAYEYIG